ncbi:DISARM anti-phage system protein DrmE domain-containing protein [Nocardioides sp. HB32]
MSVGQPSPSPGLADVVCTHVLRVREPQTRPRVFAPTAFDLEALEVADAAIAARTPLALVVPSACPDAPVLLAAAAVVGAVRARRSAQVEVAVAAPNLGAAVLYEQLLLRDVRLGDLVPRDRVAVDGTVRGSRRTRSSGATAGRLHLTAAVDRVGDMVAGLDALVVAAAATSPAALGATLATARTAGTSPVPVVYVTTSPVDPALEVVRAAGGVVWGWDAESLAVLAAAPVDVPHVEAGHRAPGPAAGERPLLASLDRLVAAGSSTVTVVAPAGGDLDAALAGLWQALGALSGAYRGHPDRGGAMASRWAWSLYHVAATLPVSATRYDEFVTPAFHLAASKFGDAAAVARAYARTVGGVPGEAWYRVADAFEEFIAASARPDKLNPIIDWVRAQHAVGGDAVLLVRDQAAVAAVSAELAASPRTPDGWDQTIRVARIRDVDQVVAAGPVHALCVPGTLPRNAAGLLAAPPAADLTLIAAGPREARRAFHAARSARLAAREVRWESVTLTAPTLPVTPRATLPTPASAVPVVWADADAGPDDGDAENPWEPFAVDLLAELAAVSGDDGPAPPPARVDAGGVETTSDAVVIHVRDHTGGGPDRVLLAAPNDLLTRRRAGRVERSAAKATQAGDVLLLVDHGARRDLMSTVIGKLAEASTYATLALLIDFWHRRAAQVRDGALTYADVLGRMAGTAISSETTVGSWVRGDVDGPLDKADVARFAGAVGDRDLAGQASQVGWALDTLHRVHRKLGFWLSAQIGGAMVAESDVTVDAALDIHVADLLDAVSLHTVVAVEEARRQVPVTWLGTLLDADDLPG